MMFDIERKAERLPNGLIRVTVKPPKWAMSGDGAYIDLTQDQFDRMTQQWLNGDKLIQDALPDLSASQREVLMTGIGPEKWDEMFKEKE